MPTSLYLFGAAALQDGTIDFDSDTLNTALLAATYTPNLLAHEFFSDVSAHEVTGTGYVVGGAVLASAVSGVVAADNWATVWQATTDYATSSRGLNYLVRPTTPNGYLYRAVAVGTSGGSEPTWPTTIGMTVVDNGVVWANVGRGVAVCDADDAAWSNATISARYAVIYKDTGNPATSRLLLLQDFGSIYSGTNGNFTVQWPAQGILLTAIS